MKLVIGVDIGTTNIKVIACSAGRNTVYRAEIACETIQERPELSEQDPVAVLHSVNKLLKEVFLQIPAGEIAAVSFSAAMHSIIAMDGEGNHLTHAILWGDTRSYREEKELKASGEADRLYQRTGVPLHPSLPLCKIIWLKRNRPEIFDKTKKFISLKEYIFLKLFGVYVVDYAIAGATGMLNIHHLTWDEEALEAAGISSRYLSEVVPSIHAETVMLEPFRTELGLAKDIPFVIGSSDGCLANIGTGVLDETKAALTIGTSGAVRTTLKLPHVNAEPSLFCYAVSKDLYVKGGAVNNGAFTLQWLIEDIFKQPLSNEVYAGLLNDAASVPAGSEGLIFLPYLKGERAPVWNARAKGVLFGLNSLHEQRHMVKAVLEGVGYSLYDVFCEMAGSEKSIREIYVSGGFIKSRLWVQVIADIFNKTIVVTDAADASAIGAAHIGFCFLNISDGMQELSGEAAAGQRFIPDRINHDIYMQCFLKYRSVYAALKNEFE